ncbi:hypothetical protein AAFN88_13325 [Pelagibius sp. CAU 1746]|uniref:hypothetical protein n=1 Tax=Pelagibius sp. CAU 1746 TaxID=3140370 RepID=UPI00325AF02B
MDRLSPTAQALGTEAVDGTTKAAPGRKHRPTVTQLAWLSRGLDQAGGKLPLFDHYGQRYDQRTIRSCIEQGWAEPWFKNPIKPDWLVCRLTGEGRRMAEAGEALAETANADLRDESIRDLVDDLFA